MLGLSIFVIKLITIMIDHQIFLTFSYFIRMLVSSLPTPSHYFGASSLLRPFPWLSKFLPSIRISCLPSPFPSLCLGQCLPYHYFFPIPIFSIFRPLCSAFLRCTPIMLTGIGQICLNKYQKILHKISNTSIENASQIDLKSDQKRHFWGPWVLPGTPWNLDEFRDPPKID